MTIITQSSNWKKNEDRHTHAAPKFLISCKSSGLRKVLSSWLSYVYKADHIFCVDETFDLIHGATFLKPDFIILDRDELGEKIDKLSAFVQKRRRPCHIIYLRSSDLASDTGVEASKELTIPRFSDFEAMKLFKTALFRSIKDYQLALAGNEFAHMTRLLEDKVTPPMTSATMMPKTKPKDEARIYKTNGETFSLRSKRMGKPRAMIIGCSTGGPPAISRVLADIETVRHLVPIFIVQHMQEGFIDVFANNISKLIGQKALIGTCGMKVKAGEIYLAPFGFHMLFERRGAGIFIKLDDGPEVHYCKPAVDPTFQSAASIYGGGLLGVVLTGLGADAGQGAAAIAEAHGTVVAQDSETSVVWGMPRAAAKAGACNEILPLAKIGPTICDILVGASNETE